MPLTTFIDSVTPVTAAWLNGVDAAVNGTLNGATDAATTRTAIGLGNVDNTSDVNKPVSTAQQTALNGKADTVHVHTISDLTQTGAVLGQVPTWDGAAWVPQSPSTLAFVTVAGTTQNAISGNHYILTNAALTTVTLSATPADCDLVGVKIANNLTTNIVARNGKQIEGLSEDLTIDSTSASFVLRYCGVTLQWRLV